MGQEIPHGLTAHTYIKMKFCLSLLVLSLSSCLAFPQPQEFTAAQLLVLRQHEAIAAANTPSPLRELPGWDEHQAQLNAVYPCRELILENRLMNRLSPEYWHR